MTVLLRWFSGRPAADALRLVIAALSCLALSAVHAAIGLERDGGPFIPTPQHVVEYMLDMAKVGPQDLVADLGSGDGRVVLSAARFYGARAVGIEIDPELVAQASAQAKARGVADRARFIAQDMFLADLRGVTVVTLYVLPAMMARLKPKLLAELAPGARIVSHDFLFDDWTPDRSEVIDAPQKLPYHSEGVARLYLWIVPEREGSPERR